MSTPAPDAAHVPATGWLRRNRGWLAGAIVMGALAFGLSTRGALQEYGRRGYTHPVEGGAQGWTDYAGSRWRLVEVLRDDTVGNLTGGYVHGEASLLAVVYEVIPGTDVDAGMLDRCRGRLRDARGRVWGGPPWGVDVVGPSDAMIDARASRRIVRTLGLDTGCGSREGGDPLPVKAMPSRPFRFFHLFLVPRDLPSHGLTGEIVVNPYYTDPPGSYVRFRLGAARPLPRAATSRN